MTKRLDLTGKKFGRLTVLGIDEEKTKEKGKAYWFCKCDCGNVVTVKGQSLTIGDTKSCGCYNREVAKQKCINRSTHKKSHSRLYCIYYNMKNRCANPNHPRYKNYGARGITICEEWSKDFMTFYNWAMANGYKDNLSIDRIDNNSGYSPDNCRWVDVTVQNNNTRRSLFIVIEGVKHTLKQWYKIYNPDIGYDSLRERYHKEGFQSVEQLFRNKAS